MPFPMKPCDDAVGPLAPCRPSDTELRYTLAHRALLMDGRAKVGDIASVITRLSDREILPQSRVRRVSWWHGVSSTELAKTEDLPSSHGPTTIGPCLAAVSATPCRVRHHAAVT